MRRSTSLNERIATRMAREHWCGRFLTSRGREPLLEFSFTRYTEVFRWARAFKGCVKVTIEFKVCKKFRPRARRNPFAARFALSRSADGTRCRWRERRSVTALNGFTLVATFSMASALSVIVFYTVDVGMDRVRVRKSELAPSVVA